MGLAMADEAENVFSLQGGVGNVWVEISGTSKNSGKVRARELERDRNSDSCFNKFDFIKITHLCQPSMNSSPRALVVLSPVCKLLSVPFTPLSDST